MKKYFYLQWKRIARYLPGAVCVTLILMSGLLLGYGTMTASLDTSADNQKIQVAICGDVDDPIMQMGLATITALDSTKYSIDIMVMEEAEASRMLEQGDIAAYAVVPKGFMEHAMSGHLIPLRMITTAGAASLVSIFKDEVTKVIVTMVVEAQKGVFGLMDGFQEYDIPYQQKLVDGLAFEYVDLILCRGDAYTLEELGIADSLSFSEYLLCGLTVLLVLLACLPFVPLMIRRDPALSQMLHSKGKPVWMQAVCSYAALFLGLVAVFAILLSAIYIAAGVLAPDVQLELPLGSVCVNMLPVLMMAAAMSFLLCSLSSDLISGVLLQFFVTAAMCFVSGCMYPVYFFPERVQRLAALLPTGIARSQLACIITGEFSWSGVAVLVGFSAVFVAVGAAVQARGAGKGGR